MSGWGTGEGVDPWAKATAADPAPSTDNGIKGKEIAFDTAAMKSALPEEQTAAGGTSTAETNGADPTDAAAGGNGLDPDAMKKMVKDHGWAEAVPYDYGRYTGPDITNNADWESNAAVYKWDGEEGDIGPVHPELEVALFGEPAKRELSGIDFSKIREIQLFQEGPVQIKPILSFDDAPLHPAMRQNVELAGYKVPTPIQMYALPAIHQGYDLIAIAQTGSGKTAAYLIPILNKLMGKAKKLAAPRVNPALFQEGITPRVRAEPLVVIVCPSRELAIQIFNEARKFCYRSMLRPCVLYGGGPIGEQIRQLQKGCDILVASPGRLIDIMGRPDVLTLRRVRYMVIDEADEMLHDDWTEEFNQILSGGEQEEGNILYMLFSATFPKKVRDLAKTHLAENHVRFRVGRAGSTHANITQRIVWAEESMKAQALIDLLTAYLPGRTIIFVNLKRTADEIDGLLYNKGFPCTSMHSGRTQKEREDAMRAFRRGDTPIMIATGVSARGIDVKNVLYVINYDLPSIDYGGIEEYTHRIGRTGRIGHTGTATSFYNDGNEAMASVLTRTLLETNQEIPDFLESYIPEGEARTNLKFEADSDWEGSQAGEDAGGDAGGWGADNGDGDTGGWGGDNGGGGDTGGWGANNGGGEASGGWGSAPADKPAAAAAGGGGW